MRRRGLRNPSVRRLLWLKDGMKSEGKRIKGGRKAGRKRMEHRLKAREGKYRKEENKTKRSAFSPFIFPGGAIIFPASLSHQLLFVDIPHREEAQEDWG